MNKVTLVYTNGKPYHMKAAKLAKVDVSDTEVEVTLYGLPKRLAGSVIIEQDNYVRIGRTELLGYSVKHDDGSVLNNCLVRHRRQEFLKIIGEKVA